MTEDLAHSSAIVRHPSATLHDHVFTLALPSVDDIAAHKNVPFLDGEQEVVLRYALKGTPRKTLKRVTQGDSDACFAVGLAISHAIDVLAMKRLIMIERSICQVEPLSDDALDHAAEMALEGRFANDKGLTIRIWRNPVEEMTDYLRSAFAGRDKPVVKLSEGAAIRIDVRGISVHRQPDGAGA